MFKGFIEDAPRLSRANYLPRVIAFAGSFFIIALLAEERGWTPLNLVFLALYLLIYPHLLVVASRKLSATSQFEIKAILADSLILGFLAAWIDFYMALSFVFLVGIVLNASVTGGIRQLFLSLALFMTGALAGGALDGWQVQTSGPFYIDVMALSMLLLYVLIVGFVAFNQNAHLLSAKSAIEERKSVFRALVEISSSADLVGDVQEFVQAAVKQIHDLYPEYGVGMVVREVKRSDVMRFAGFEDISTEEQDSIMRYLSATRSPDSRAMSWIEPNHGATFQIIFDHSFARGNEAIIVFRADAIKPFLREAARLFLDLLGVHVENKLLALDFQYAAERDPLTDVFNRGRLDEELASVISSAKKHNTMEFAVLMIDVIGLKRVNDKFGHEAGDKVIQDTAKVLKEVCRDTDILGRYGGDEFVILCLGSNRDDAERLRKRLKRDVTGLEIELDTDGHETTTVPLELSIGLASSSETKPEEVMAEADEAMYRDKTEWYKTHERYR